MKTNELIGFAATQKMKERIVIEAARQQRTVSSLLRVIISDYFKRKEEEK